MTEKTSSPWRERLTSPLWWHFAGAGLLLLVVLVLGVRFGLDWAATNRSHADILAGKQLDKTIKEAETAPLRGLDKRLDESRKTMQAFYAKRIPASYSLIAGRIGDLQVKNGVRLTRVQYSQGPPGTDLTEISMDAGISGDYPSIARFINALERDQLFFIVRAMSLTGQQGGTVNLRIRVSTWLRPADAEASGLPSTADADKAAADQDRAEKNSAEKSSPQRSRNGKEGL
jgi:Tfp pilus assembly protein PilO